VLLFIISVCFGVAAAQRLKVFGLFALSVLLVSIGLVAIVSGAMTVPDVLFAVFGLQAGYVAGIIMPERLWNRRRVESNAGKSAGRSHLGISEL